MIPTIQSAIPDDWRIQELGALCSRIVGGGTPSRNVKSFWEGDIPWATVKDISGFNATDTIEHISKEAIDKSATQVIPSGTIIIATRMSVGNPVIYSVNTAINQDLKALFTKDEVNKEYLVYFLQAITPMLDEIASGTTVKGLSLDVLTKQKVLMPTNEAEQRAIATALADVDALIEAKRALLEKKRAIKQGAMQELLTGRRRLRGFPVTPMKKTDIGEIPEDWNVCKMGENGTFLTTASYTRSELSQYGDVACIHYGDIHTKYKTWLSLNREEVPHIDYSKVKNYPYLQDGDLIIADASEDYAGLSDWVELTDCQDKKCIGGLHTIVFRPIEDIFAFGYLGLISSIGIVKKQLISKTVGTKVYSLTASMLKDLLFPIPSTREEQASIYNVIRGMDSEVKAIESEIEKLRNLKQGMMRELLTGRIRLV